jgi:hypothetical protein
MTLAAPGVPRMALARTIYLGTAEGLVALIL